jgi:HK97 family phage major capsid protein
LGLLAGDQYESGLSKLASDRYGEPQRRGLAVPHGRMLRDLNVGTASAGGSLATTQLETVALATRPPLVLEALGAVRLELSGSDAALPRFDGGNGSWIGEGESAASMATTVASAAVTAHAAAARLAISRRVRNGNRSDIEVAILGEIESAVRNVIEQGFIQGSGANNEPLGIVEAATGAVSFAGATPTWGELMGMIEALATADADLAKASFLVHPTMLASLLTTQISGNGGEVAVAWADGRHRIAGVPVATSTNAPTGKVILADFSSVQTCFFGAPQIIEDSYSGGKSLSGASEIVVVNYCDVGLKDPAHIVVGSA